MLNLAIDTVGEVSLGTVETSANAVSSLFQFILSLFYDIPESYYFIIYFVMAFMVCVVFKFLIDFLKIIFSMIFTKGGF